MFSFKEQKKADSVMELLERMEELFTDLRWEYLEMARRYDEAMKRMEDLESDKFLLEEMLAGREEI